MSVLTRGLLEQSTLADLHEIASELSIDGYRRLRKADLVDAVLERQGGEKAVGRGRASARQAEPADEAADSGDAPLDGDDEGEAAGASSRRRRGRRGGRGRAARAEGAEEGATDAAAVASTDERSGRSRNGASADERSGRSRNGASADDRSGRSRNGASADDRSGRSRNGGKPPAEESEVVEGVVELLVNGSGFLRVSPPEPSEDDVYISAAQVKRCELVSGDRVSGPRRAAHRSERFASLVRIDTVNGRPAAEISDRGRFDDLSAQFPTQRFELGSEDPTLKAVELLTPFGRGSRVTITGGRWSGKSHLLHQLAGILAGQEDVTVMIALAGIRPEELPEWNDGPVTPGAQLTFSASSDAQDSAVEGVIDQARRLAARGSDAVVLIDSLDGLHPLSARRALASARKLSAGGSLTVIATSSEPLGGETTVIALDAGLALAGRHPALDLRASGTLRAELLVGVTGAKAIAKERAKTHQ
jgi:transcription termination factor Rho